MTETKQLRWFQGVPRYAWTVLIIGALGWMFDTMDQHLFNLVRLTSLTELMTRPGVTDPTTAAQEIGPILTAIFLLGWAAGGFLFGMLGDRLGRTRTMMITILIYATFTGLNALVQTPWQYALCRFLTALGVGGEFAAGAALVAEVWPARSRPMALGLLQALSAVGNMMAAVVTLVLSAVSWRYVFVVGAVPALLVLWIRSSVREPEQWQKAHDAAGQNKGGGEIGSIAALFRDKKLCRNTIAGVLLATAGVGGVWGVGFFLPDLIKSALKASFEHLPEITALPADAQAAAVKKALTQLASKAFFVQNIGAFIGMIGYAAISERVGRKPALAGVFALAFGAVQVAFWSLNSVTGAYAFSFIVGVFCLAPFSAYAVYFPELYPTRLRATGVGFCYNCARILAAAAPFTLGKLAKEFADAGDPAIGLRKAATVIAFVYFVGVVGLMLAPETKGKPLPE
jgi:MFS family permease